MSNTKWTVVQHSAFGYAQDPTFERGLETRQVNAKDAARVIRAGGLIFNEYLDAETYAEMAMYPLMCACGHLDAGHVPKQTIDCHPRESYGLIPRVSGSFAKTEVDGLRIYVPATENAR